MRIIITKKPSLYAFGVLLLLLFVSVVILASGGGNQPIAHTGPPRLKVSGNQLATTDTGRVLRLKGFVSNFFRRGTPLSATASDVLRLIDEVKELGGNAIDFYYDPWKLYSSPSQARAKAIALLDAAVDDAGKNNIYVLAELSDTTKNIMAGEDDSILKSIAGRYRNKSYFIPGVWAEPSGVTAAEWEPRLKKMVNIVRKVNPDTPIVISGIAFGRKFGFLWEDGLPDPNVILSVHDYPTEDIAHYNGHPSFEIDDPDLQKLQKVIPIMYGEFGGFWGGDFSSPEDLMIIKGQLAKIDEYGLSTMGYVLDDPDLPGLGLLNENGDITPRGEVFGENYLTSTSSLSR